MSTIRAGEIERNHREPDYPDHVCAGCDGEHGASTYHYPRKSLQEATMRNSLQYLRNGGATRCAICDGNFGLIRHYSCKAALCSKKCADRL
jgi:hypothetical protein